MSQTSVSCTTLSCVKCEIAGPDFGSPPSFVRKKLLTVLSDCGKVSSLIDSISIVKRYASELSHAIPVASDDEALSKAKKEVKNDKVHFVWAQFSELNSYFKKQTEDIEKLNRKLAEMISLLTCNKKSTGRKCIKYSVTTELKDILSRMDARVRSLYSNLPANAMLIICTGHGDTAMVHRLRKMLTEEKETAICREKLVKVLEELQAQAEVGPDFGSPPSFVRKKLLTVLSDCGKVSSLIDSISIVKRYASELSHAIPVASDDEALSKAKKEVKNDKVHFVWAQFSELNSYFKKQTEDIEKLNRKLAEMISLLTCNKKSTGRKCIKYSVTTELKDILSRMDARVRSLYSNLPANAMLIICTGHGDTAMVHRLRKMLTEEKETAICREKLVKVLEELQAQAEVGPDFGSPPSFVRKKLLTVLSDCGKVSSLIDSISIVKRYASELSHAIPVASDDEVLSKAKKEVKNDKVHFVWAQFSELNSYFKKQTEDIEKLNRKLAEMISLLTCNKKSTGRKCIKYSVTTELKDILSRMDARVRSLYSNLPANAMLIICTGHGDTAMVHRLRKMLTEEKETAICREKLVKVLEELQAQAEVGLCFVGVKH
ncbi:unnamed protein product [Ilex paraguariensis]|uniref:Small RNA degrading nuclease 5 n=1 Tax=Ilex paraguariensis TaxID=185542 RepID=A0ABC8RLX6_9AQUA